MARLPVGERRRQFIDAAVHVVSNEGVAKATTRRIAEQAGAPVASLHYCFDTKEELFQAAFQQGLNDGVQQVRKRLRAGTGLHDGVKQILAGFAEWMERAPEVQQAQWELTFWALRNPGSRHLPNTVYRHYLDSCTQLLNDAATEQERAVDLETIARQIIALLDGHGIQWIASIDPDFTSTINRAVVMVQALVDDMLRQTELGSTGMPANQE